MSLNANTKNDEAQINDEGSNQNRTDGESASN